MPTRRPSRWSHIYHLIVIKENMSPWLQANQLACDTVDRVIFGRF